MAHHQNYLTSIDAHGRSRRSMTRSIFFVVLCGAVLSSCPAPDPDIAYADHVPYSKSAYQAGRADAEKDLRSDRLIIEIDGFPLKGEDDYAKILKDRYQIELKRVADDIVNVKAIGHEKGYNEVSVAEVKRRFGSDVLDAAQAEAAKHYDENPKK